MDPASMKAAMDMMKNMPQDQLQRMMAGMGNISPEMMAQAQSMASRMKPEDWQRATEQMKDMKPEELESAASQAKAQFTAQQKYVLTASQQLKNEGNSLHGAGKYSEALEKYERAKSNVADYAGQEAADLRRACTLNLSSCYLNLKNYVKCIEQCNEVLNSEADNMKALYRRGQAYMGTATWEEAVEDLRRAMKLSANDPTQQGLIRDKLQEAKDKLSALRAAGTIQSEPSATGSSASSSPVQQPHTPEPAEQPPASTAHSSSTTTHGSTAVPAVTPEALKAAADQIRQNPGMVDEMARRLDTMTDADLAALSKQMGVELKRDQLEQSKQYLKTMKPEQVEKMARMQAQMADSGLAEKLRSNPQDPEAMAAAAKMMQDNPDMMGAMTEMMEKMSPEELSKAAKQMGMPESSLSPEMMKMAANTFKNMKPEDLKAMTEMAAQMRPQATANNTPSTSNTSATTSRSGVTKVTSTSDPSVLIEEVDDDDGEDITPANFRPAPPAAAAASGNAAMSASAPPAGMPQLTPEMAKMAAEMMSNMSPEVLETMTKSMPQMAGGPPGMPPITPEMAKMAADMMKNMSPETLAEMSSMMGSMGPGAGDPSSLGAAPAAGFGALGANPGADLFSKLDSKMIKNALGMMKGMDSKSLASMLMTTGMCKSEAQAETFAKSLQNMSDTQIRLMTGAATAVQTAVKTVRKTKDFIASKAALYVAVGILILAILLRYFGFM